jgi:hypothetical protein
MLNKPFKLSKTPRIVYTLDKSYGIGQLYLNGKRIKGLIDIKISAHTRDDDVHFARIELEVEPKALADSIIEKTPLFDLIVKEK